MQYDSTKACKKARIMLANNHKKEHRCLYLEELKLMSIKDTDSAKDIANKRSKAYSRATTKLAFRYPIEYNELTEKVKKGGS